MCAILQLVSASLNTRPIVDNLGEATNYVSTATEQTPAQARIIELKPLNKTLPVTSQYSTVT